MRPPNPSSTLLSINKKDKASIKTKNVNTKENLRLKGSLLFQLPKTIFKSLSGSYFSLGEMYPSTFSSLKLLGETEYMFSYC